MKRKSTDKKLRNAISVMVDIIADEAASMKKEDERNIKQFKELTGAAKELAAVIKTLDGDMPSETERSVINVIFGEEESKWAI